MTTEDRTESPTLPNKTTLPYGSRRRLLRGGLATAPVLLTLVNRPVMAQSCQSASVFGSASLSRPSLKQLPPCAGVGPLTWSLDGAAADWPAPMAVPDSTKTLAPTATATSGSSEATLASPSTGTLTEGAVATETSTVVRVAGTTFDSVFGNQGGYGTKTLSEVLRLNSNSGRDGLARHLVAAYLNALKGLTPPEVLDVSTVKNIWTSFVARGYYEPTAGIRWFPDHAEPASPRGGLIAWLKTTMPG